tara:strand:- start:300 stop:1670 length:1371 start_codon:yes stop_codon:yes gene_type:complete
MAVGPDGVAAVTAQLGTATFTVGATSGAGGGVTISLNDATFTFNSAASASTTASVYATAFVAAWTAETGDTEVSKYAAANTGGVITFTEVTAAGGTLAISDTAAGMASSTAVAAIASIAAVTAVAASATHTFTAAAAAGEVVEATVGDAVFNHAFSSTPPATVALTAAAYATAWNASTDSEVALYTAAANSSGVVTYTQDATATATNVKGTLVSTLSGTVVDGDILTLTAKTATLAHTFTTSGLDATQNAAQYVAAWNASTDADVSLFTASNAAGVITLTEDIATGTMTGSRAVVTNASVGSSIAATSPTATAGTSALTVGSVDGGTAQAVATIAAGATGVAAVAASSTDNSTSVNTLDISTAAGATAAITSIDLAIAEVGAERAKLGAFQNRLSHTVNNLSSMIENTSAARSRIQDADFAVESANLAKNQVMQQAGTAMLAQANASSQGVLSLLK